MLLANGSRQNLRSILGMDCVCAFSITVTSMMTSTSTFSGTSFQVCLEWEWITENCSIDEQIRRLSTKPVVYLSGQPPKKLLRSCQPSLNVPTFRLHPRSDTTQFYLLCGAGLGGRIALWTCLICIFLWCSPRSAPYAARRIIASDCPPREAAANLLQQCLKSQRKI